MEIDLITNIPIREKNSYLVITTSDGDKLNGVEKFIQRATNLYFTKIS